MSSQKRKPILITLALPIYIPSIIMTIGSEAVMLAIPLMAIEMTNSYASASLTFAMIGVGVLIGDIPAGIIITKFGIRKALTLGVLITFFATLIATMASTAIYLGITGILIGIGRGVILLSRVTYISEATIGARGRAMSAVGGSMRVGTLIGPILGGFMIKFFGFQVTMLVASIIFVSSLLFIPFIQKSVYEGFSSQGKNPIKNIGQILRQHKKTFLTAGLAVLGLQLLRSARPLLIPLWGKQIGLDAAQIGLISGIPMGLEMTMFYPVGTIMDRFGRKLAAVPCIILLATGLALVPFCNEFKIFLLVALLAAFGNGLGSGIVLTLGADFSPNENRAEFLGVWRLIGDTGHMTSPFLISLITQVLTLTAAAFAASGIGLIAALIMIFLVKESRYHSLPIVGKEGERS